MLCAAVNFVTIFIILLSLLVGLQLWPYRISVLLNPAGTGFGRNSWIVNP